MRVFLVLLLLMAMPVMAFAGGNDEDGNAVTVASGQATTAADLDAARAAEMDAYAPADSSEKTAVMAETAIAPDMAIAADLDAPAAGGGVEFCGLRLPCTCLVTCVNLAIKCCWDKCSCECPTGTPGDVRVDLLGADGAVLASATIAGPWCDPCNDCNDFSAQLDHPVNPQDVCSIHLSYVGDGAGINVKAAVLRLLSESECSCKGKWSKVWKSCIDCCQVLDSAGWTLVTGGCGGCGNCGSCKSSCGSCNKCENKCGCNKCSSGGCGSCNKCASSCNKCGCKSKCGSCNKCESKCDSCSHKSSCGCGKCH